MRLIDADVFLRNLVHIKDLRTLSTKTIGKALDDTPTVEAIPVEWIKNVWLKCPDNQGEIEYFPTPKFEDVMNWLIHDWEKENGRPS